MEEKQQLEQIIAAGYHLAVLNTSVPAAVVARFKRLSLTTGCAAYDWSADHGLYRLGIEHLFLPRTRLPVDVLAYITGSRHDGIYLLRGFEEALATPTIERQLLTLMEKRDGVRRLVCLVGSSIRLPASLSAGAALLRWDAPAQLQLS